MAKRFLFLALTAMAMVTSSLVAEAGPAPSISFKGGPVAATQAGEFRDYRWGFAGGLGGDLQWNLRPRAFVAAELDLLYMPRGAEVVVDGQRQGTFEIQYYDIALAAKPGVLFGRTKLYLLLGGSLNILSGGRSETATGASEDLSGILRSVDVSLLVGAGAALQLPPKGAGPVRLGTIFLEFRHDHGLLDTNTASGEFRNRASSLLLGLSLALGSSAPP